MKSKSKMSWVVRRVIAKLFDISILLFALMTVYSYIAEPIISSTTNIKEVRKEYYDLGVENNIFIWNEELNTYRENDKISQEEKDLFYNNERVALLEEKMARTTMGGLIFSSLFSAAILFCVVPLVNKDGKTLGKFALGMKVVNQDGEAPSKLQIIIRESFIIFVELVLGFYTYFLIPLVSLGLILFTKNELSLHDLVAKTDVVPTKIKYEVVKEEDDEYYKTIQEEGGRDLTVGGNENVK